MSELAECLEVLTKTESIMPKDLEVTIIDRAAVVNMIKPAVTQRTLSDYVLGSFIPYIKTCVSRIDVVWDEYLETSLKATTRAQYTYAANLVLVCDNVYRRRQQATKKLEVIPKHRCVDKNKQELFRLSQPMVSRSRVLSHVSTSKTLLSVHMHEEADTRILLHAADAIQYGYKNILLRTVDTEVLVLAIAAVKSSKNFATTRSLNPGLVLERERTVVIFQLMIYPTASVLKTWTNFPDVNNVFLAITNSPLEISSQLMETLEQFVVLLYDRTSTKTTVNDARKQMFIQKGKQFDNIPSMHKSSFIRAHQTYCLPGRTYLGSGSDSVPSCSKPSRLGPDLHWWIVKADQRSCDHARNS